MSETSAIPGQDSIQESYIKRIAALQSDNKSLTDELETTRMEREEVRAKLFESLIANKKYLRELERLRKENLTLKRMPLFLATVLEMGPDYVLLRQHGNNQEFITTVPEELTVVDGGNPVASARPRPFQVRGEASSGPPSGAT